MTRLPVAVHRIGARVFRGLRGRMQWRVLWFAHDKFIVGVSGIVSDADGRVLVLRPRYWSAATWGLPGGYMKSGETPARALVRELREETGLSLRDVVETASMWGFRLRAEVQLVGRVDVTDAAALRLAAGEIEEARFCRPDDLPDGILDDHRERIRRWALDPPCVTAGDGSVPPPVS